MLILLRGGPGAGHIVDQHVDATARHAAISSGVYTGGFYRIVGPLPAESHAEYVAEWMAATTSEMSATIDDFANRHLADQGTIAELQAGGITDRGVIQDLLSDGVIDRNKIANLEAALASARRIGAAIGIVMSVHKVTEDQAFNILRRTSETTHRKMRDVADDVLLTGSIERG